MITNKELAQNAEAYISKLTCYLKGTWGQYLTQAVYNAKCNQYPDNKKYKNEKYVGTDVYPFDCVCFVKNLLANGTVDHRITYEEMCNTPLGDCTTQKFYDNLYDCLKKGDEIPAGYGISNGKHVALTLGGNKWIDCNFTNYQNGLAVHYSNPIDAGYRVGKIKGVVYENDEPVIDTERQILSNFCNWLIDNYLANK